MADGWIIFIICTCEVTLNGLREESPLHSLYFGLRAAVTPPWVQQREECVVPWGAAWSLLSIWGLSSPKCWRERTTISNTCDEDSEVSEDVHPLHQVPAGTSSSYFYPKSTLSSLVLLTLKVRMFSQFSRWVTSSRASLLSEIWLTSAVSSANLTMAVESDLDTVVCSHTTSEKPFKNVWFVGKSRDVWPKSDL